ncbi:MAG: DUF721 domain-containing protein [Deltaproteobacteria bacterium]|nr:DUF721 domain-containing protein [Myxococcales bacterium]MDP3214607.1 DUF721 domain-containing protein [Deltaproteobacteria bacterium]
MKLRRNDRYEPIGTAHIGTLLAEAIRDPSRVRQALGVWPAWEEAVGPEVAAATQPVSLRAGVLTVWVRNTTWLQELHAQRQQLLARVQRVVAGAEVTELRFKQGPRGGMPERVAAKRVVVVRPAPVPYELTQSIRAVPSPALRGVLIRVASRWAGLQRLRER